MESIGNGGGGNSVNIVERLGAEYPRVLVRVSNISINRPGHFLGPSGFLCNWYQMPIPGNEAAEVCC